ncbi:MAG: hypothetical protein Q7U57_17120 [Methylovulum sp.]|nr:hypothetical protein [Methylovulum sp.]
MTIHISTMMPDRSLDESAFMLAVTKIAIQLAEFRLLPVQNTTPHLDLVFLLPSRQEQVGFEGLRLRSFSRDSQTLRIECAVPEKMLDSIHAERFIIAIMQDATDAAHEYFCEQQLLFNAVEHIALTNRLMDLGQLASTRS